MFFDSYPDHSYENDFKIWARSQEPKPFNNFDNDSAVRVGFIGEYFDNEEKIIAEATKSAECTHNHPESIKSAVATALCIYYSKHRKDKNFLKDYVKNEFDYKLFDSVEEMQEVTKNDDCEKSCQKTMSVALSAFLLSSDYQDCIHKVLSTNCDTNTVGCIAGGIAENYYGKTIPFAELVILKYVDDKILRQLILNRNMP
jgi:ADP-ribosylglycohydrolase